MRARDVMQRGVKTVAPETSIEQAVHLMLALRISGLPVVNDAGSVVGMLSEGDLIRRVELGTTLKIPAWQAWFASSDPQARAYVRSHARKVEEVMTTPVVSVSPDTELSEVVALMESRRIKRVPVIESGRLVGILTRSDLIRALSSLLPKRDTQPVADAELRRRVLVELAKQRWAPRFSVDVKVENGIAELRGVITDEGERAAMRVLAENVPGVRGVVDHLVWVEKVSGIAMENPVNG
jgi:CBS domain-containing protein